MVHSRSGELGRGWLWSFPRLDPSGRGANQASRVGRWSDLGLGRRCVAGPTQAHVAATPLVGPSAARRQSHWGPRVFGPVNTTKHNSRHISHFAHSAFVVSFKPRDIGHALSDSNWVNVMHKELENFERNRVW